MDDFSNYPKSIAEHNAEKANQWAPRDALVCILRAIDDGKINPDILVVSYRQMHTDGDTSCGLSVSSPDEHATIGVLEIVKAHLTNPNYQN